MQNLYPEDQPMIPRPNQGEGAPAFNPENPEETMPGEEENQNNNNAGTPMIPLPEQGRPVAPGQPGMGQQPGMQQPGRPVTPLPNPGEGGPAYPGLNIPMFPGMGTPAAPGPGNLPTPSVPPGPGMNNRPGGLLPVIIGTIVTTYPRPNEPCRFCTPMNNNRVGTIRFLNAAAGYNPFSVFVNENLFSQALNFAEVTEYEKVNSGSPVITLVGPEGYIFLQRPIEVPVGSVMTIAIINTNSGLDLLPIQDEECRAPLNMGCVRAANLSPNSGPLNVVIGDQYVTFMNVRYPEVTDYKNIWPGHYNYYVSRNRMRTMPSMNNANNSEVLLSASMNVRAGSAITIYVFNWRREDPNAIRALIVEEQM